MRYVGKQGAFGQRNVGLQGTSNESVNPFAASDTRSQLDAGTATYRVMPVKVGTGSELKEERIAGNGIWVPYMSGTSVITISLADEDNTFRLREGMSILGVPFRRFWYSIVGSGIVDIDIMYFQDTLGNRVDLE